VESERGRIRRVKYWEIVADNLSKAGWSWGCVSAVDSSGRTIFISDGHRDRKRFVVRAEPESANVQCKVRPYALRSHGYFAQHLVLVTNGSESGGGHFPR
jgi:hypothetical protein